LLYTKIVHGKIVLLNGLNITFTPQSQELLIINIGLIIKCWMMISLQQVYF